jgi:hypothetical protein
LADWHTANTANGSAQAADNRSPCCTLSRGTLTLRQYVAQAFDIKQHS